MESKLEEENQKILSTSSKGITIFYSLNQANDLINIFH